jgi:Ca2+-binding RTX toxin-like protein
VQLKDGSWVVTWQSIDRDRTEADVYQRHYYDVGGTLTIDAETAAGDAADDTFLVRLGSLSEGDYISGGAGNDTLLMINAGVMDLTKPSGLTGIETIIGSSGNDTIIADGRLDDITDLQGGDGHDELRLLSNASDQRGYYDFSNKTLSGIEVIRLAVSGRLIFSDKATALLVQADQGLSVTVQLHGNFFSEAEKAKLFRQGVKTIYR